MSPRRNFVRLAAAAAAVAALSACAPMRHHEAHHGGQGGGMGPGSQIVMLSAQLNGAQEVPPTPGGGSGQGEFTFNKETRELTYQVTYSGLSGPATAGHIHGPAAAGVNAGVIVPFASPASPITGKATLNPTQAGDLLAGLYYVNVHTAAFPGGEIRGQLRLKP